MAKRKSEGYLSAKESRRISRENRRVTKAFEQQHKRKNVPEADYAAVMHDPGNTLEIDDLHSYFFTDVGTVKSVDGVSFSVPTGKPSASWANPAAANRSPVCRSCSCCSGRRARSCRARSG